MTANLEHRRRTCRLDRYMPPQATKWRWAKSYGQHWRTGRLADHDMENLRLWIRTDGW